MKILICTIVALLPLLTQADVYKLNGTVDGKYPIVIELEDLGDNLFSGRYAYESTLNRDGDEDCSWLRIYPNLSTPYAKWDVTDCNGKIVETWSNPSFTGRKYFSARMTNIKGKSYDIVATLVGQSNVNEPLTSYFRQHIGEYVSDFDMFKENRVQTRLENLMGIFNYNAITDIYEVQVPIEYNNGMYWASGFMAHMCCDPAAIWAYDTYENSFYIWIRKDDQEYWWSETGKIPYKFREIVNESF
ncbi:MAG: hypothetical protein HDS66_08425 [Bacteroidales bacterium]|nr:hypothetical protein [Bacteroidales bacterium]